MIVWVRDVLKTTDVSDLVKWGPETSTTVTATRMLEHNYQNNSSPREFYDLVHFAGVVCAAPSEVKNFVWIMRAQEDEFVSLIVNLNAVLANLVPS